MIGTARGTQQKLWVSPRCPPSYSKRHQQGMSKGHRLFPEPFPHLSIVIAER